jgi:tetratricopeptide (TPR) repeat protein
LLDLERHNLYRAAEFGLDVPEIWLEAAELILQADYLIERRAYWHEWIPLLKLALVRCPADKLSVRSRLLHDLGKCYRSDRQSEKAIERHNKELQVASKLGDPQRIALAHSNMCKTFWQTRQYDLSEEHGLAALELFELRPNNHSRIGSILNHLGLVAQSRGDYQEAEIRLRLAIDRLKKTNLTTDLARVVTNLAIVLESSGKIDSAVGFYQEAARLLDPTNAELDKSKVENSLGTLYYHQGDFSAAEAAYRRANSAYVRRYGPIYHQASILNNLGCVCQVTGNLEEAEKYYQEAITLWKSCDAHLMLANTMGTLAEVYAIYNRSEEALSIYEEAILITGRYPDDAWARQMKSQFNQAKTALFTEITKKEPAKKLG